MLNIRWTPEFAIGIEEIDAQHHELIEKINALTAGLGSPNDDASTRALLDQLADYTRHHFSLEEQMMGRYPIDAEFRAHHCSQHAYFIGVLKDFTKDFDSGRKALSLPFIEYLVHWILHHIVVIDRDMAKRLGGATSLAIAQPTEQQVMTVSNELDESERHLVTDMHHLIAELSGQVNLCLVELTDAKARLAQIERKLALCPKAVLSGKQTPA